MVWAMRAATFEVDGVELRGDFHPAPTHARPKGALVLVHGFNSSRTEFGDLAERLAAAGYATLGFDQRGYGTSGGEPGRTSVERAVADIRAAIMWLQSETSQGDGDTHPAGPLPLGIVGHSLGGSYAIAALGQVPALRAAVVAHPLDRLFDELAWYEKLGYHVVGTFNQKRMARGKPSGTIPYKLGYESLFVSPEAANAARSDGFLLGRVSLANYEPALTMSASTWARNVAQPVLVIGSPHDKAVQPAHIRKVFDALPGPKEFLEHAGGHSCYRDLDGRKLAAATIAWFDRWLGA